GSPSRTRASGRTGSSPRDGTRLPAAIAPGTSRSRPRFAQIPEPPPRSSLVGPSRARMIDHFETPGPLASPVRRSPNPRARTPERRVASRVGRYLSGPYLSVRHTGKGTSAAGSFRTDPEVFRDLRNTLRLGGGPAVDLPESESLREPRVQPEPACEPRVQGEDRLSSNEFLAGRGDEDASMPLGEVQ